MSKIYFNKPQREGFLVDAFEEVDVWPRGSGKSTGRIAPRTHSCVFSMPQSMGVYVARTFQQLLTRTLPGVINGLRMLGYHQDRDYFIGSFAPKKWKWEKPFTPPVKAEYFMHFRNGTGISFISQDRPGMAAGLSVDWIIGDEAKHLKKDLFYEELMPANRGNKGKWTGKFNDPMINNSLHHSVLLLTDMPVSTESRWILNEQEKHDEEKVSLILALQHDIIDLKEKAKKTTNKGSRKTYLQKIHSLTALVRRIRRGDPDMYARTGLSKYAPTIMYTEPEIWENLDVLGLEYIDQQKRILPDFIFRTSILNKRVSQVTDGFYPDLSETVHGYDRFNNSHFESIGYDFDKYAELDSRQDGDVDPNRELDIACDYGGNFNCLVVGQHHGEEYRFVNDMHVKVPLKIKDLVRQFKKYYRHHKNKTVNFFYDHTATPSNPLTETRFHEEYIEELQKSDEYGSWYVNDQYMGRTPQPMQRFEFWRKFLGQENPDWPRFRYNRTNCEHWSISCMMAPMKISSRGYEKDKSSERPSSSGEYKTPQEESTHFSDAGDTLAFFRMHHTTQSSGGLGGIMIASR